MKSTFPVRLILLSGGMLAWCAIAFGAAAPTADQALRLTPSQPGVDYTRPTAEEAAKCAMSAKKIDGKVGWVVEDPHGLTLRRFVDTNGDNVVDQWSYYKDGVEVYRDIDSDFNGKVDQCRWFNTAGTRWAEVKKEDGKITAWKQISAEEVTAEVVAALGERNAERFAPVVLKPEELKALGLGAEKAEKVGEKIAALAADFAALAARQKLVTPQSHWVQFSAMRPGVVPAGTEGSTQDLRAYENVVAIVETGAKHGQVQIGTLVQVGDGWRVIDLPQPLAEGQAEASGSAGFFFHASMTARPEAGPGAPTEEAQKLLDDLAALDKTAAQIATPEQRAQYTGRRADLLEKIAQQARNPQERAGWLRQLADMVIADCQQGVYADGPKRLEALAERLAKNEGDKDVAAYVKFHAIMSQYNLAMQGAKVDYVKVQTGWMKNLEQYVADYPKAPAAAEAMLQLAMNQEYAGQEDEARKYYGRIIREFPKTPTAQRAAGAQTRLDCVGKAIALTGKSSTGSAVDLARLRGKVVVVHYWASMAESTKNDLAALAALAKKYGNSLAVLGVNLDLDPKQMTAVLAEAKPNWPQIHEPGGLDSRPAVEMGILSLPTLIVVDAQGKVAANGVQVAELEKEIKKLIR